MLKIALLGITGVLTALFLGETYHSYRIFISMTVCLLIFFYGVKQLSPLAELMETFLKELEWEENVWKILLKMMGITYLADFSANLCRDAGYYAIAGQIDFFGKAAVMTLGVPVVVSLLETIQGVLS